MRSVAFQARARLFVVTALLTREQFRFVTKYGFASINAYAETQGFVLTAVTLVRHLAAQAMLNINIQSVTDEERDTCQYEVSRLACALPDLVTRAAEHDHLADDEFIAWYREQSRITGLAKSHLAARKASWPTSVNAAKTVAPAPKTPAQRVDEMFANPAAIDISAVAGITSGERFANLAFAADAEPHPPNRATWPLEDRERIIAGKLNYLHPCYAPAS